MADGAPHEKSSARQGLVAAFQSARADGAGRAERARQWAKDNADAIRVYNAFVEEHGVVGDDFRSW